jgi:hypothetical protein
MGAESVSTLPQFEHWNVSFLWPIAQAEFPPILIGCLHLQHDSRSTATRFIKASNRFEGIGLRRD